MPVELVRQQTKVGPTGGRGGVTELPPVPTGPVVAERVWALVRPLGPGSRFGRLRWGGPCVNCGDMVPPGERGWIEPTFEQVLCEVCWPG